MCNEKVTVIIPTYKRCDMLGRAIDSVLNQSYKNVEIIVVDDNDNNSEYRKLTEEFMKKYNDCENLIYLKHKKNMNGAVARNTGLSKASGKYIAFLDDDDEFLVDKLGRQVETLRDLSDEYGAVYCGFNIVRGSKVIKSIRPQLQGNLFKDLLLMEWGTGSGSNVLFRRNVFNEIGVYDTTLVRHQDWDILLRMFKNFKIGVIDEPLLNIYKDSRINIPNAEKFSDVKRYFLGKFSEDIGLLGKEVENKIYHKHTLELSIAFIKNKKYKQAIKLYKQAAEICKVSLKNKFSLILIFLFVNTPFKEKILVLFGRTIEKLRLVKA